MLYRDHRGGFKESMETVIEINSLQELYDHVKKSFSRYPTRILFHYQGHDPRNKWDTYTVMAELEGNDHAFPIGQSNGKIC